MIVGLVLFFEFIGWGKCQTTQLDVHCCGQSEDILNLQLDMPERSTQDYDQVLYDSHDMGGFHQAAGCVCGLVVAM